MTVKRAKEMTGDIKDSVLRRMTVDVQAASQQPSVMALLRLSLEQASDRALGLPLEVKATESHVMSREALGAHLSESALFAVLEGQVSGFLTVDCPLVGGIVEHQTIGHILAKGQLDRKPTRVDAALVAPFVDAALERITRAAQSVDAAPWAQGLAFGAMVSDRRSLLLALPVRDYHVYSFDLQVGEGQRQGRVTLGFGDLPQEVEGDPVEGNSGAVGRATVRAGVLSAPARLDAVIARLSVPLRELQSLKVGDTLSIPADALRRTRLEARGTDHAIRVSLGQLNGFRAVRLLSEETGEKGSGESARLVTQKDTELALIADAERAPQIVEAEESVIAADAVLPAPEAGMDDLDALLEVAEDCDVLTPV